VAARLPAGRLGWCAVDLTDDRPRARRGPAAAPVGFQRRVTGCPAAARRPTTAVPGWPRPPARTSAQILQAGMAPVPPRASGWGRSP